VNKLRFSELKIDLDELRSKYVQVYAKLEQAKNRHWMTLKELDF